MITWGVHLPDYRLTRVFEHNLVQTDLQIRLYYMYVSIFCLFTRQIRIFYDGLLLLVQIKQNEKNVK